VVGWGRREWYEGEYHANFLSLINTCSKVNKDGKAWEGVRKVRTMTTTFAAGREEGET
jgi:hypothetical protein